MTGPTDPARRLFATAFLLSQSWKNLLDAELAPSGLSAKQWLLLVAVESFGEEAPTLHQAAERYGATRQATKQLALRLARAGFMRIETDEHDGRALRLLLTPAHREFWDRRAAAHGEQLMALFDGIDPDALATAAEVLTALLATSRAAERDPSG